MFLLRKFFKNENGSLAVQFGVLILPLLALLGAGVDYSRIATVKTNLQATLDNDIRSMPATAFRNRAEMERYIVSLAGVNLDSDTIKADISIKKDKLHIDLRDKVKTPMLSLYGQSETEVVASIDINPQDVISTKTFNNEKSVFQSNKSTRQLSQATINTMKRSVRKQISNIKVRKHLSADSKRGILKILKMQLENLEKL